MFLSFGFATSEVVTMFLDDGAILFLIILMAFLVVYFGLLGGVGIV